MSASSRLLARILDHVLHLLPDEPADSKRLDDIVDAESQPRQAAPKSSLIAASGLQRKRAPSNLRAVS
jgi:hypothetical protein